MTHSLSRVGVEAVHTELLDHRIHLGGTVLSTNSKLFQVSKLEAAAAAGQQPPPSARPLRGLEKSRLEKSKSLIKILTERKSAKNFKEQNFLKTLKAALVCSTQLLGLSKTAIKKAIGR